MLNVRRQTSGEGVGAVYTQGVKGPADPHRRGLRDHRVRALVVDRLPYGRRTPATDRRVRSSRGAGETFTPLKVSLHDVSPGVKKLLMSRPVQHTMDGEVAAIETVKRLLES